MKKKERKIPSGIWTKHKDDIVRADLIHKVLDKRNIQFTAEAEENDRLQYFVTLIAWLKED